MSPSVSVEPEGLRNAGPIIRAESLVKEFSRPVRKTGPFGSLRSLMTRERVMSRAVDGVSFTVERGELVGYLGPNGAGKSTTIKMLTGILVPTSGHIEVDGRVPWKSRVRNARSIGVVFGQRSQLWPDLPLRDSFALVAKLYGVDRADFHSAVGRFTEILDMGEFLDTPARNLSLGQRMRGDLTAAMLYSPPLLYLDEPTVGLDVVAKRRIREFIAETNAREGTTVVLTTHDLVDVERLCRRVLLIDRGRVLYDGTLEALRRRYVPHRDLVVTVSHADDRPLTAPPGTMIVSNTPSFRGGARVVTLRFDPKQIPTPAIVAAVTAEHAVVDLSVNDPDLETVITEIYGSGSIRA